MIYISFFLSLYICKEAYPPLLYVSCVCVCMYLFLSSLWQIENWICVFLFLSFVSPSSSVRVGVYGEDVYVNVVYCVYVNSLRWCLCFYSIFGGMAIFLVIYVVFSPLLFILFYPRIIHFSHCYTCYFKLSSFHFFVCFYTFLTFCKLNPKRLWHLY